ncbi:MAG: hypothetical protein ABIE22_00090 [archaeon]
MDVFNSDLATMILQHGIPTVLSGLLGVKVNKKRKAVKSARLETLNYLLRTTGQEEVESLDMIFVRLQGNQRAARYVAHPNFESAVYLRSRPNYSENYSIQARFINETTQIILDIGDRRLSAVA